jgi:hypothetical protein
VVHDKKNFEECLIKLLWGSHSTVGGILSGSSHQGSVAGSLSGHSHPGSPNAAQPGRLSLMQGAQPFGSMSEAFLADPEKASSSSKKNMVWTW